MEDLEIILIGQDSRISTLYVGHLGKEEKKDVKAIQRNTGPKTVRKKTAVTFRARKNCPCNKFDEAKS